MENVFLRFAFCLTILFAGSNTVDAQNEILVPDDFATQISRSRDVSVLSSDLFGDHTDISSGATEFVVTDVDLPGNNNLSVAIKRRFAINEDYVGSQVGPFDSEIEIPHLHGVFADNPPSNPSTFNGWTSSVLGHPEQRCSASVTDFYPKETLGDQLIGTWEYDEFWHGNQLYVPGRGDQQMQIASGPSVDPASRLPRRWVTKDRWYFSCLPTTKNGVVGEGFLAHAPDGNKYYFDWIVKKRPANTLKKPAILGRDSEPMPDASRINRLVRAEYWILPTRIEDRFGNFVEYAYTGSRLDAITASDGRFLAFDHTQPRTSLTDGSRRWYYDVSPEGMTITYPDASFWSISISHDLRRTGATASCGTQSSIFAGQAVVTVRHPSGATGAFTMQPKQRGLSYVPERCISDYLYGIYYQQDPKILEGIALTKKVITGPGLSPMTWNHTYGPMNESFSNQCASSCPTTRYIDVSGPDSTFIRYTFGNRWHDNEGLLLKTEAGSSAQNILRTDSFTFDVNPPNPVYTDPVGYPASGAGDDWAHVRIRPLRSHSVAQQETTFLNSVNTFDALARPLNVTKSSSLGYSRTDSVVYEDNVSKYVLGQIKSVTKNGSSPNRVGSLA